MKATLIALVLAASLHAQSSPNMNLLAHVPYPIGTCADVWAEGDLGFVARRSQGFDILDLTDPSSPAVLFSGRSDLFVQDVKSSGNLLFCSNESGNGQAVVIFDVSDPTQPQQLGSFGGLDIFACNNLDRYGTTLYCASLTSNRVVVLDITNPSQPVQVRTVASQSLISLIHDVAVVDDRLYVSWLSGGFEVHDLSSPQNPSLVLSQVVPTSLIHNAWPLSTGSYVATTDEVSGGHLRVWDTTNPAVPNQIATWRAHPIAVMHNLFIAGDLAYITNYTEGLRVVSLLDPANPVEVGFYDTFAGANPFTFGAWGVYPRTRDILVADFNTGLYLIDFTPVEISLDAVQPSVTWGQTIVLQLGADSTPVAAPLRTLVDLSFSITQVGPQSAPLLQFPMTMPPGLVVGAPYSIPLPSGSFGGPFDVVFALTLAGADGPIVLDTATTTVRIN